MKFPGVWRFFLECEVWVDCKFDSLWGHMFEMKVAGASLKLKDV